MIMTNGIKERPILFNPAMIAATRDGRKTQTRRVVKPQMNPAGGSEWDGIRYFSCVDRWCLSKPHPGGGFVRALKTGDYPYLKCPHGQPGDFLVPLCTWSVAKHLDSVKPVQLGPDTQMWSHWDGGKKPEWCGKLRPGRFMPLFLRERLPRLSITDIRVERVQEISEEDALAEGVRDGDSGCVCPLGECIDMVRFCGNCGKRLVDWTDEFRLLWDSINAKRGYSWESNPWVWVMTFRMLGVPA